jgi:hypothetical protein
MTRYEELTQVWDHLPAAQAVARAWMQPSPAHGTWHRQARVDVEYVMPLLARALDRLLLELADQLPSTDWRLWEWPDGAHPNDALRVDRLRAKVRGRR